ncbi:MAG: aminotransferase class V-fold PLP-dependent enzyme, partial [Acidobacteriales bacterium]|nr:aminotransferase class V-fold PLP-dependent enzyme [Terriglobales bacterium]
FVNMAGFFLASHVKPVRDAIEEHRRRLDQCPLTEVDEKRRDYELQLRQALVEYFGGHSDDYALTGSTTMGLGTVYCGLKLRPGQEILTSEHDHYSTHRSLEFASARTGIPVRKIALFQNSATATAPQIVEAVERGIRPNTRILALTWVHSSTGMKLPIGQISEVVRRANSQRAEQHRVIFCVDGVHGFGVENTTIEQLGCDFFMAGCHKWILGPRGTGLIFAKPDAWAVTQPTIPSFEGIWRNDARALPSAEMTPGGFHAFEHFWALESAFRLHLAMGKGAVQERIHSMNHAIKQELAKMPHVKLYTPQSNDLSAGIVCFDVNGMKQVEVVERLKQAKVLASQTPYKVSYARVSASLLNNEADVERTVGAIRALA